MLMENRSHKQQHCLRGKGAGRNIMASIVDLNDKSTYLYIMSSNLDEYQFLKEINIASGGFIQK